MKGYLATCLDPEGMPSEVASTWIQTGLAFTRFAFAETRFSVDWALAWALIGEWTTHHLFPPPKSGKWPRNAHVNGLEAGFHHRSPSLVTWARACFEQGALPSLSVLPGAVEIRSLPGDKMFQATHVIEGFQRPCVLHGYGGAKSSMPTSLPALAESGWTVLAAALLGTAAKAPLWTQNGFRPVIGTTIDSNIVPSPISCKEESLLLSRWWPAREASQTHSLTTFLQGVDVKLSPSQAQVLTGLSSAATAPDAILCLLKELEFPMWTLLPLPNRFDEVTDALTCCAFSLTIEGACLMAALSMHGLLPHEFPREAWNLAVGIWFKLGGTQLADCPHRLFNIPAGQVAIPVSIPLHAGHGQYRGFARDGREVPVTIDTYQVSLDAVVDSDVSVAFLVDSCLPYVEMRKLLRVECTGLGGSDLGSPTPWDILVRTGLHHEEVYGPSLARMEVTGVVDQATVQYVGLGLTKAAHEFLMLHYFATDSAQIWDDLDAIGDLVFPDAPARRTRAYKALLASHVAPSYRRMPHPLWSSCMTLIVKLCLGTARSQMAYFVGVPHVKPSHHEPLSRSLAGEVPVTHGPVRRKTYKSGVPITPFGVVRVWGFSAGSFTGMALLDIVAVDPHFAIEGTFGAVACPPALMDRFAPCQAQCIRLYHYGPDQLCCWAPLDYEIEASHFRIVYVHNYDNNMDRHFGKSEHSYSHWLWLDIDPGVYKLWALCRDHPSAAFPRARDEAPLRLVSWLSFRLSQKCHEFIQTAMDELCSDRRVDLLSLGQSTFPNEQLPHLEGMKEFLLSEVALAGMAAPPVEVRGLFETFLRQLSLPRLVHFFDLVLAQMVPRWETSAGQARSRLVCHILRIKDAARNRGRDTAPLRFSFRLQFLSHAGICHIAVHWQYNEVLLFSDPAHVGLEDPQIFRTSTAMEHHRKNIQLGLRTGQAALISFTMDGQPMKAIWILMNNKLPSSKGGNDPATRNPFWKFVVPVVSFFAWLPASIAHSFCAEALATIPQAQYADPSWSYHDLEDFEGPGNTKRGFGIPATLQGLIPLGDTRNSQELAVFCNMPRERLRVTCGLAQEEALVSHHPDSRGQLVRAAQHLLRFLLVGPDGQHDFEHAGTLKHVFHPLVELPDRHLLASAIGLTLALLTGRTDLCTAGVFGAGKTRAAAAVIAGLIAIDPTLSIMVCTKENAAAQAFAEHVVSMQLPDILLAKFGRLIGFHEAQKGASARTAIDVGSQNRNHVLRGKQVIIGCGGGFRHETSQKYSPILEWIEKVQLCVHDEAQQFGNLDEVAALARLPSSCLCIWTGDHKQTPGGLKKTDEAKAFRKKIMKRPLGLRSGSTLYQPHHLLALLGQIAETSPDTMAHSIMQLSADQARRRPACILELERVLHAPVSTAMLECSVKCAALAVLWAFFHVQESGLTVASTIGEAAGLQGRHQWGLILPSVSLLTYQTVVAVRYPGLVHTDQGIVSYGRWVGGWGPRYLAFKRERGRVRVPSSLTEDKGRRPLMSSFWNHERTWLRLTP